LKNLQNYIKNHKKFRKITKIIHFFKKVPILLDFSDFALKTFHFFHDFLLFSSFFQKNRQKIQMMSGKMQKTRYDLTFLQKKVLFFLIFPQFCDF
jgi:hypothetical protein